MYSKQKDIEYRFVNKQKQALTHARTNPRAAKNIVQTRKNIETQLIFWSNSWNGRAHSNFR